MRNATIKITYIFDTRCQLTLQWLQRSKRGDQKVKQTIMLILTSILLTCFIIAH